MFASSMKNKLQKAKLLCSRLSIKFYEEKALKA